MIDYITKHWIEIIGSILGIIYLYYEYRASFKMWAVGIAMSLFYTYVYVDAKFYSFALINIYFILAGIYGWIKWFKRKDIKQNNDEIDLRHCPTRLYLPISVAIISIFCILVFILKYLSDSSVTYGDSFITTFSIVAMWMLAQRYVEQWILLIVLNIFSVFIYFQQHLYPTTIMYIIFSVVSCFGYIRWKKSVQKNDAI